MTLANRIVWNIASVVQIARFGILSNVVAWPAHNSYIDVRISTPMNHAQDLVAVPFPRSLH